MKVNRLIRTVAVFGSLLAGTGALAQQNDTPLADEAPAPEGPSGLPVMNVSTAALRDERDWLYDHQPTIGDLVRPSILLSLGAVTTAFGVWWFGEFMRMTPAYRENAEWLAIGTIAAGAIVSGLMGTLFAFRERRRTEYQERVTEIQGEFRKRKHAPEPAPSEPVPPPPPLPPAAAATE